MQIKHFTEQKYLEIALKCVQKDVKNASKIWFLPTSFNIIAMPNIWLVAVAFQSEVFWREPFYFGPAQDLGGSGLKQQHL